ncbi:MAG TPA: hypothetical protein PKN54_05755 [Candidatus Cloacimonas acidaminovorans]|nr:hypothetical protein [Candidatus Cloacimonas acidaminovorans]
MNMPVSEFCKNLYFTNLPGVGQCFTEYVFFGDSGLSSLVILILIAFVGIKAQLPLEVMYPGLLGFTFVLYLFSGASWLLGLFLIGLLIGGILFAITILQNLARG